MYQILAYILYLSISSFITFYVGWRCYVHGIIWLKAIFDDEQISSSVNRMLLLGYYLVNIGYISWSVSTWQRIYDPIGMIHALSFKVGGITLILGLLHYLNIATILFFNKRIIHSKDQIS